MASFYLEFYSLDVKCVSVLSACVRGKKFKQSHGQTMDKALLVSSFLQSQSGVHYLFFLISELELIMCIFTIIAGIKFGPCNYCG